MSRPELGHKFSCVGCGARFYDLNRSPAVCPKCEVQQPAEKPRVVRAGGGAPSPRARWRPAPVAAQEEAEPVAVEDEDAEADAAEEAEDDADSDVDDLPDIADGGV